MESFIKIYRKLLDWEWFNDSKTLHLFIYFLLKANYKNSRWRGVDVNRGQLIFGRNQASADTGISTQSIRTSIERLKSTNEITIKSTNKYSVVTIVKYDTYQNLEKKSTIKSTNKLTNEQPATNQQLTTSKEVNNLKEEEEYKYSVYDFKKSLLDYGFEKQLVDEWLLVRKNKKATNTQTAFNNFVKEVEKSLLKKNEVLRTCVEKSWSGLKADWLKENKLKEVATSKFEHNIAVAESLAKKFAHDE